ncbi:hypothetical protein [Streptomyces pinistramenti]|uniref:hypothetical protein n=1 Tax=Streptomyces pinistramenti TaxID=2884812 RepID=UPI001D06BE66|nr:hypothetical protein [Streptomyces pinistramenti]MCB5909557.1 hypothetical protein [Streptomyces pinistramenti]
MGRGIGGDPGEALGRFAGVLGASCPEGRTELRGSLASGTYDRFSDIDLRWTVPGERFAALVAGVGDQLGRAQPLLTARSDPDFHGSADRRLLTYFFRDLPLFRRLDLEIRAAGPARPPAPTGGGWPPPVSALANAVGAVKAVRRGRPDEVVRGLLDRGFARTGSAERACGAWAADLLRLVAAAERTGLDADPGAWALAARVRDLVTCELT